jgi:hypothetical protein
VKRALWTLALGGSLVGVPGIASAGPCNTDDAGSCDPSAYCAQTDGGAILDGAAGVCDPEPCLMASDCNDASAPICDTSQTPFECVECISSSDCPGVLYCDPKTRTCIPQPPFPDASTGEGDGGASEDAGEDASADGSIPGQDGGSGQGDASSAGDGSAGGQDASGSGSSSGGGSGGEDAAPGEDAAASDQGSLRGGAWDCEIALPARGPSAIIGLAMALAAFAARARSSRRRR